MNIQEQLQQWASRGAFKFPEGDDKGGFTMRKEDSTDERVGVFQLTPEQTFGIQCVLDGIIPVWRPVGHYPLPSCCEVLALFDDGGGEYGIIETGASHIYNDINSVTHWMPLPQAP